LRGYTRPLDLSQFNDPAWMWEEDGIKHVSKRLYSLKSTPLIPEQSAGRLNISDERTYKAGSYGTDFDWSYGAR